METKKTDAITITKISLKKVSFAGCEFGPLHLIYYVLATHSPKYWKAALKYYTEKLSRILHNPPPPIRKKIYQ
jgi:hypothetical protein